MFNFKENIEQTRINYKNNSPKAKDDLSFLAPSHQSSYNPIDKLFFEQNVLYEKGSIHYASLLQANSVLFKRFTWPAALAAIIYSTDTYFDDNKKKLRTIAAELYSYKGVIMGVPQEIKTIVDANNL